MWPGNHQEIKFLLTYLLCLRNFTYVIITKSMQIQVNSCSATVFMQAGAQSARQRGEHRQIEATTGPKR